jgi:hypothetical protein
MQYFVVEAQSAKSLQEQVQNLLDQGWEPHGGMSVATYAAGTWWYFQALIRHETRTDDGEAF